MSWGRRSQSGGACGYGRASESRRPLKRVAARATARTAPDGRGIVSRAATLLDAARPGKPPGTRSRGLRAARFAGARGDASAAFPVLGGLDSGEAAAQADDRSDTGRERLAESEHD